MSKPRSKQRQQKTTEKSNCYKQFTSEDKKNLRRPEPLLNTKDLRAYRLAQVKRPAPIVNLVLKGAGVLGPAYAGAILELEQQKIFTGIQRVAGSSAGGLLAIFIALGFPPQRINEIMFELEFKDLLANPDSSLPRKIWNYFSVTMSSYFPAMISNHFAKNLDDGNLLQEQLEKYIEEAITNYHQDAAKKLNITNYKNITFTQLQAIRKKEEEIKGTSTIKELYLTGTNKTINKENHLPKGLTYFSHEHNHANKMSIAIAGRITASHPFAYHSVLHEGNFFTDGAVADSCPVTFFDDEKYMSPENTLNANGQNPETLAMLIESKHDIDQYSTPHKKASWANWIMEHLFYLFRKLAFSGLFDPKVDKLREDNHTRILQIHDCYVDQLNFKITEKDKNKLIKNGQLAMRRHIRNYLSVQSYLPANGHTDTIKNKYRLYKNFQLKYAQYNREKINHILKYELQPAIKRLKAERLEALKTQKAGEKYFFTDRNRSIEKQEVGFNEYQTIIKHNLILYRQEREAARAKLYTLNQKRLKKSRKTKTSITL